MNEIGEMLRLARESSGVSIKEASKDLEIDELVLENIEAGKVGAFKDIFELKNYISLYSKYLGLDTNAMIDEFNEYMFEYTSKIPVKEIEKTIEMQLKEEQIEETVSSPYTKQPKKYNSKVYLIVYILLFIFVLITVIWSIKQITVNTIETSIISYRR